MATSGLSRVDRLINMIGGEDKLPPRIPQPQANEPDQTPTPSEDTTSTLQAVEDDPEKEPQNRWWDAMPHVPQPRPRADGRTIMPAPPRITDTGDMKFDFDPRKSEPAPLGMPFSPFIAVTKFPYKFVSPQLLQPIASAFFDEGKIWAREWNIYYVWNNNFPTAKPVTFIPAAQLLELVDEINSTFPHTNITPDSLRADGLIIDFDDFEQHLRPFWLGQSTSRAQYDYWTTYLPSQMAIYGMVPDGDRSLEAWRAKMEAAVELSKAKNKARAQQRQAENVGKRQGMVRSLLRAQRYLGLLAKSGDSQMPDISALSLTPIDCSQTAPHPFDQDVVFVAVDVEAYERPPHDVTEVGVATLDTRDLLNSPPGEVGENWQNFVRARHFRIIEKKHLENKQFIHGCPENFEFGKSDMVGKDKIAQTVASCFKQPFSGPAPEDPQEKRNIILVGHDITQDIAYLQKIGFNVFNNGSLIEQLDTTDMFRSYKKDPNSRSLGGILQEFDMVGWHLHNAGNDAVYTLWAMLAISVKAASERGSEEVKEKYAENLVKKEERAVEQAKKAVKDEAKGWDYPGDDGGAPVPPEVPVQGPRRPAGRNGGRQFYTSGGALLDV